VQKIHTPDEILVAILGGQEGPPLTAGAVTEMAGQKFKGQPKGEELVYIQDLLLNRYTGWRDLSLKELGGAIFFGAKEDQTPEERLNLLLNLKSFPSDRLNEKGYKNWEKLVRKLKEEFETEINIFDSMLQRIRDLIREVLKNEGHALFTSRQNSIVDSCNPFWNGIVRKSNWMPLVEDERQCIKYDYWPTASKQIPEHPHLVSEKVFVLSNGGSVTMAPNYSGIPTLAELLETNKIKMEDALKVLTDAFKGVARLHQEGLFQTDFKPQNIFAFEQDGQYTGKNFDLNGCCVNGEYSQYRFSHAYFEPHYFFYPMDSYPPGSYSDIFAAGLALLEVYLGPEILDIFRKTLHQNVPEIKSSKPGKAETIQPKVEECLRAHIFNSVIPSSIQDLIVAMLHYDQQKRPNFETVVKTMEKQYSFCQSSTPPSDCSPRAA
jgi:serine/threonine protein kinase